MNTDGTGLYTCKECHKTESLWNHTTSDHKEEQLEDRRNAGVSSCNSEDGTDQRVQSLMFMMMILSEPSRWKQQSLNTYIGNFVLYVLKREFHLRGNSVIDRRLLAVTYLKNWIVRFVDQAALYSLVNKSNFCTIVLSMFISFLCMFRETVCPSSGETTVFMLHLVLVILYGWLSCM